MREKTVHTFKLVAHFILIGLSIALSVNLFIQFSDKPFIQIMFGMMAGSFELLKIYLLVLSKYNFSDVVRKRVRGILEFTIYLGLAFLSAVASLGFTLVSIQEQSFQATSQNYEEQLQVTAIEREIDAIDQQIDTKLRQQSELPFDYITASDRFTEQINELRDQRQELVADLNQLLQESETTRETVSQDMFTLLGEVVRLNGRDTMFYMMILLVVLLEISIALTTGDLKKEVQLTQNKDQIVKYIEGLFDTNTNRLNSDDKVSKATGIPLSECHRYKKILSNITWKGSSLITSGRGGTFATFTKENTIKIVMFHIHSGHGLEA
jgi:HPt (histidine-containing phosphotransfer) domain-containing protein